MLDNTFVSALSSVSIRILSLIFSNLCLDLFIVPSTPDMPYQEGFSISSLTASALQQSWPHFPFTHPAPALRNENFL